MHATAFGFILSASLLFAFAGPTAEPPEASAVRGVVPPPPPQGGPYTAAPGHDSPATFGGGAAYLLLNPFPYDHDNDPSTAPIAVYVGGEYR